MNLRPLPTEVARLLSELSAPPRLVAHLTLVHDVACQLVEEVLARWPSARFDAVAVRLGAASHDIGKAVHREELSHPGKLHETTGEEILLRAGWSPSAARFARTHGHKVESSGASLEDLLVMLADRCWKGKRDADLETKIARLLATDGETWRAFSDLDEVVESLTAQADERLDWQMGHSG